MSSKINTSTTRNTVASLAERMTRLEGIVEGLAEVALKAFTEAGAQEAKRQLAEKVPAKKAAAPKAAKASKATKTERKVPTAEEKAATKATNQENAAWMRARGIVPSGQAWAAYKGGERNIAKLGRLNDADGVTLMAKKVAEPKAVAKKAAPKKAVATKVDTDEPAKFAASAIKTLRKAGLTAEQIAMAEAFAAEQAAKA